MAEFLGMDALLPSEMAKKAEQIGIRKAGMDTPSLLALAMLAGAFIALGAIFSTVVISGTTDIFPYGFVRLLAGLVFCLGLILVIVAGGELFTGNNLIVMAWVSRKVSTKALVRNWIIVYIGNFAGALLTAVIMFFTKQYTNGGGAVGRTALALADNKVRLDFLQAFTLGMMCNALVCIAVWLTYSARSTTDKIIAIIFPISAFVAAGFEHSIANMYFIPIGLLIKHFDADFVTSTGLDTSKLTWDAFLFQNLLPVTLGNIIGGAVMVGAIYWFIYLRPRETA